MADGSWDNGGYGQPAKAGLPLWGKVLLGCGIFALVVLVTCVGGVAFLANKAKKDPEGLKNAVLGFALDKVKPEWDDFRAVVDQLRTPEGCKTLYAANPELARTWASEADFLKAAEGWRPKLAPTPELTPQLMERQGLRIHRGPGGKVEVGWSPQDGRAVYVTFEGRKAPGTGPRKVVELDVR